MKIDDLVHSLSDPAAYPHEAEEVEVHHTHISVVFLAGDFAYKVKKPVTLDFLDYGTLERRRRFCHEEVRLNRRLAPEVYLGVVPLVRGEEWIEAREEPVEKGGEPPDEEVVEWAVRMKRLPADRTLEALLERNAVGGEELEGVAAHLAGFHARAAAGPEVARHGRFSAVARNARANLTQSEHQVGDTVHGEVFRRLSRELERALARTRPLVEARADRGVPRDTHGDLRLDHVYLLGEDEPPTVIDCIEFNPGFRFADPVADMAFLAMDLQRAGRWRLSRGFADAYFRASGDEEGRELLDLYVSYRAAVRGKVQGIKASDPDIPRTQREAAAATAEGHWLLALGALAPPEERPGMVLAGGLPGTGKSTLARGLAKRAGFRVVRSDVVRKELAGLDPEEPVPASFESGIYAPEWSDRTYRACLEKAEAILLRGKRVAVDASFHAEARRKPFLESARRLGVRTAFLVCEASPEVARGRLEGRQGDPSDAGPGIHRRMAERWEEPGEDLRRVTVSVSTEATPGATLDRAVEALRARGLF